MQQFSTLMVNWYRRNSRILPWRETKSPYKIWLSEIIMQQTRVEQGLPYYNAFTKTYESVYSLAAASEQEVLKLWQGLGYYSRARNLHAAAKQIVAEYDGEFPSTYKDIINLKGVGEYTAAAIASFAFDLPHAVLDGNAFRVLSRYFNDPTPIDTGAGRKVFREYAEQVLDKSNPAEHNQAIMEIGALVCKPKNPDCLNCPLNTLCLAYNVGVPTDLPVKSNKTKVSNRFFNYFIFPSDKIQLEKREGKGIWRNLYQLPLIETEKKLIKSEIKEIALDQFKVNVANKLSTEKHILSHQIITATFWTIKERVDGDAFVTIPMDELEDFPLPRLIDRFIENNSNLFS